MCKINSKFSEVVKFHNQEDNERPLEPLVKCEILDSDVQKPVPSGDSSYRYHMLVQRGDKYGLFRIIDPVPSPTTDFSLISVENPFIFDEVLICDTRCLWTFVMVKQNDKWGVIETSIDYSLQLIIPIESNSSEEALKALEKLVPNQHLFVYNPFETYEGNKTVKEQIIKTLRATGRENIENVIAYMTEHGFFTERCHRHHCYQGGLADHAWQTYQFAIKAQKEYLTLNPCAPALDEGSLAICSLLHDFCDCHGMHHIHNHGSRSARMLKELGFHLTADEFLAIRFHMSLNRHINHPLYNDARHCHLRNIVHEADGKSAKMHKGSDA